MVNHILQPDTRHLDASGTDKYLMSMAQVAATG